MPVRAYVASDTGSKAWPPTYSHEMSGALGLLQRLYGAFRDEPQEYAVVANVRSPQADLVVITELGVGIVELKHNSGHLKVQGAIWATEHGPVKAGSEQQGFANPREQVQHYATAIRERIAPPCAEWWSLMEHNLRKHIRIQTAVCFTNPELSVDDETRRRIVQAAEVDYGRRGRFDLLAPNDFPAWAASLRFEIVENHEHQFRPYRLEPWQITALVKELRAVDWSTANALMASDQTYAYLLYHGDQEEQVFPLRTLDARIGRSASSCALMVPRGHGRVSRIHAEISRYGEQIWLRDLQSQHGTFVNGRPVVQPVMLSPGSHITLGGPAPGAGVFSCAFMRQLPDHVQATETFKEEL